MLQLHRVSGFAIAACLAFAGCSSSNSTPSGPPTNLSGDYVGTVTDSVLGSGTATATFAQHGSSAGGSITVVQTGGTATAHVSLKISPSNAVSGAMVVDSAAGPPCTFSTTGSYDLTTNVLSANYTAVTNCAGDTGSFSLTQQCTDTIVNPDVRRMRAPVQC